MKYDVVIIIFNYLFDNKIDRCIDSIKGQTFSGDICYKIINTTEPRKYSFNLNIIKDISCKKIFFCDSMSVLSPLCIEELQKVMDEEKSAAASTYILFYDGSDYTKGGFYEKTAFGKMYDFFVFKKYFFNKKESLSLYLISRCFIENYDSYAKVEFATVYENRNTMIDIARRNEIERMLLNNLSGVKLCSYIKRKCREGNVGLKTIVISLYNALEYKARKLLYGKR